MTLSFILLQWVEARMWRRFGAMNINGFIKKLPFVQRVPLPRAPLPHRTPPPSAAQVAPAPSRLALELLSTPQTLR